MAVKLELSDLEYARLQFEALMAQNRLSTARDASGDDYYYQPVQDMWVAFKVGFREGRKTCDGTCEF